MVLAHRQVVDAYVRGTVGTRRRWPAARQRGERAHRKPSSSLVWLLFVLAVGVGVALW